MFKSYMINITGFLTQSTDAANPRDRTEVNNLSVLLCIQHEFEVSQLRSCFCMFPLSPSILHCTSVLH